MSKLDQWQASLVAQMQQSPLWSRWQQLPSRDRLALAILAAFLLALSVYVLVWSPVQGHLIDARSRYEQALELHAHLQTQAPIVRAQNKQAVAPLSADQLQGEVTASAQTHSLLLERMDSEGTGRLTVALAKAPFDKLVSWITAMSSKGIVLSEAHLERAEGGAVDARLTLRSGDAAQY